MGELNIETKICNMCKQEKELSEFYSQKQKRKDGTERIYYHPACKECTIKKSSQWQKDNVERYNATVRKRNPTKKEYWRKRVKDNPDHYRKLQKEWRQNNPEKIKEYNEKHKEKIFNVSAKQWKACKEYFNYCCAYCGISETEAKEVQNKSFHKEHAYNEGANDISNCLPSCTSCNSSKHVNDYIDWYTPENPVYDEERNKLIHNWLNVDFKKYI